VIFVIKVELGQWWQKNGSDICVRISEVGRDAVTLQSGRLFVVMRRADLEDYHLLAEAPVQPTDIWRTKVGRPKDVVIVSVANNGLMVKISVGLRGKVETISIDQLRTMYEWNRFM
jgi:hypothetical protein